MPGVLPSLEGQSLKSACCCFCGSQSSESAKIPISADHACCSYALKEDSREQSYTSFSNQLIGCSQKTLVKFKRRETANPFTFLGLPSLQGCSEGPTETQDYGSKAFSSFKGWCPCWKVPWENHGDLTGDMGATPWKPPALPVWS